MVHVVDVEFLPEADYDVVDIQVGVDEAFIVGGVVVHNSGICRGRDQLTFPLDSGPRPPAHIRCRSSTTLVLRSYRSLGLDQDEPPVQMRPYIRDKRRLKDIPKAEREALVGRTRADESYGDWLKKQPADFQEEVLGVTKAKLFREGGLTMDKFVDIRRGTEYTIADLKRLEPQAFKRAGLD